MKNKKYIYILFYDFTKITKKKKLELLTFPIYEQIINVPIFTR